MTSHDFTLNIVAGGFANCSSTWKNRIPQYDQCYKFYLPVEGQAFVSDATGKYELNSDFVYFISGYDLKNQECPEAMKVHWLHFTSTSFELHRLLLQAPCVHMWPVEEVAWVVRVMKRIPVLFENATTLDVAENSLKSKASFSLVCAVEAMMLYLVSQLLEVFEMSNEPLTPELNRLRLAIRFMDTHFIDNPQLSDLADLVNMAPNSFHRLFRKTMGVTPHNYMVIKRLDHALRLLVTSNKTIAWVAKSCGYNDPLYFSKAFKRHFNISPSQARKNMVLYP